MYTRITSLLLPAAAGFLATAFPCQGAVVTFAGGTINASVLNEASGTQGLTTGSGAYVENGMQVSFTTGTSSFGNASVGDYYGRGDNVVHWHDVGSTLRIEMVDGSAFDLNSFLLTSNTEMGGGPASGNEVTWITGSNGQSFELPSNGWGPTETDELISFGSTLFKGVTYVEISASSSVYCMGVDNVNFSASGVPEPSAPLLLGIAASGLVFRRRRARA